MPAKHLIKPLPPREYLLVCFDYDPATGALTRKRRPREHFASTNACSAGNAHAGKPAGHLDNEGYLIVSLHDTNYKAHRLIWKWMTGEEPPPTIDHNDSNRANNSWSNLRPATSAQQKWNSGIAKNNKSGYRGVFQLSNGTSRAELHVNMVKYYFGTFNTSEEAAKIYEAAASQKHGEYYRDRRRIRKN